VAVTVVAVSTNFCTRLRLKNHNKTSSLSRQEHNTVYDTGILLCQHISVYLRPSSGQHTYVKHTVSTMYYGIPY